MSGDGRRSRPYDTGQVTYHPCALKALNQNEKPCHQGKNRPGNFGKMRAEKPSLENTDGGEQNQTSAKCWETKGHIKC